MTVICFLETCKHNEKAQCTKKQIVLSFGGCKLFELKPIKEDKEDETKV